MSLSNPNKPVTEERLQEFYHKLVPYMGGGSGGGGHTIEDSEGTDLTQRDTLQFGEGFLAEDDDTNEKTVITPDKMQSGDMSDVITPLPSVQTRYQKYSTEEQVIGEWIDGRPLYQKVVVANIPTISAKTNQDINLTTDTTLELRKAEGCVYRADDQVMILPRVTISSDNGSCSNVLNIQQFSNKNIILQIRAYTAISSTSVAYCIIQYTKTTDTPNT